MSSVEVWWVSLSCYGHSVIKQPARSSLRALLPSLNSNPLPRCETLVDAYRRHGCPHEAVALFHHMQQIGLHPDQFSFVVYFQPVRKWEVSNRVWTSRIKDTGILSAIVAVTALVDMYEKSGSIDKAPQLFDRMLQRNVLSWNATIAGYAQNAFIEKALETFKQMQLAGVNPNSVTFSNILLSCAKMRAFDQGLDIHHRIKNRGNLSDIVAVTALVDTYAKCGSIDKVPELFDQMRQRNVVSWNAMTAGYTQNGLVEKALETFKKMQLAGVKPDSATFPSILPACFKIGGLE